MKVEVAEFSFRPNLSALVKASEVKAKELMVDLSGSGSEGARKLLGTWKLLGALGSIGRRTGLFWCHLYQFPVACFETINKRSDLGSRSSSLLIE